MVLLPLLSYISTTLKAFTEKGQHIQVKTFPSWGHSIWGNMSSSLGKQDARLRRSGVTVQCVFLLLISVEDFFFLFPQDKGCSNCYSSYLFIFLFFLVLVPLPDISSWFGILYVLYLRGRFKAPPNFILLPVRSAICVCSWCSFSLTSGTLHLKWSLTPIWLFVQDFDEDRNP